MDDNRIFKFQKQDSIGSINSVDTGLAYAVINSDEILSVLQVNQLVAIESPESGKHIIGMIIKIYRKADVNNLSIEELEENEEVGVYNQIKLVFIGELRDRSGNDRNVFKRNVSNVPRINAQCYRIEGEVLTDLIQSISSCIKSGIHPLSIGKYSMDESSVAYLDGNKFFQRHAAIVGSTGSGKSYCVAKIIEEMSHLKLVNAVLFDIHGEYSSPDFAMDGIKQFKIASPGDLTTANKLSNRILMVPYWLLNYEEMQALLLDRSDQNAPNQAMLLSKEIMIGKENKTKSSTYSGLVTLDSPVPYDLNEVLLKLKEYDTHLDEGAKPGTTKQGAYYGKLTRFNQRLENKLQDKRMGFMFSISDEEMSLDWLKSFCHTIMGDDGSVKIVNLLEVPSDVLPLVIGLLSRIIFSVQQWSGQDKAHPIALLCDEAHLYVQHLESSDSVARIGLKSFERIAKEGRKYGVGLVVISQRPSEVNRTVLSQCNNFVSLRLTNVDDQNVIKRLLPDNLGNIADNLSLLDICEAIIVGDATLLPSKIRIDEPSIKPSSQTIPFWDIWAKDKSSQDLDEAVDNMIKQSK